MSTTPEQRWTERVRGYWRGATDSAIADVVRKLVAAQERGEPSCVFHEIHLWSRANVQLPLCPHCDGPADPRLGFHNLCRERAKRDQPTPQLDVRGPCGCWPCRREAGR